MNASKPSPSTFATDRPGEFLVSYGVIDRMQNAIVKVTTDDGLVGFGELMPLPLDDREGCLAELKKLGPSVLGQDPFCVREIHARMDEQLSEEPSSRELCLKGSIDFALYDIMGRAGGIPVYKLLGGSYDDGVPMHFSISIRSPEEMGEDTAARVAEGFRAIEVKLGRFRGALDLDVEVARIAAIREAAGPDVIIIADPNIGWTADEAIEVLPAIEEYDVYVEQPVAGLDDLKKVHDAIESPVIADESAASSRVVAEIIRRDIADMINLKVLRTGGIHEACKMLDMCEAAGIGYRHDKRHPVPLGVHDDDPLLHDVPGFDAGLRRHAVHPHRRGRRQRGRRGLRPRAAWRDCATPEAPGMGATPREELLRDPIPICRLSKKGMRASSPRERGANTCRSSQPQSNSAPSAPCPLPDCCRSAEER